MLEIPIESAVAISSLLVIASLLIAIMLLARLFMWTSDRCDELEEAKDKLYAENDRLETENKKLDFRVQQLERDYHTSNVMFTLVCEELQEAKEEKNNAEKRACTCC